MIRMTISASSSRSLLLTSLLAGALLAASPAVAQNGPFVLADDHFLCYKGKLQKGDVAAAPLSVTLADMFESGDFDIGKERGSCNPADKNGEGIVDDVTHLTAYQIKAQKGEPKHVKQLGIRVFNQLGDIRVDTSKVDRLLVPAGKDDNPLNPLPAPPVAASHGVDHYKCYKAKITKGDPKFPKGVQVMVEDQWETPAKLYDLKKPKLLCLGVDKNGEGIKNEDANQLCYQAKPAKGQAKHVKRVGVGFADQFVAHRLDSSKEELLCVPSLKDPPADFCGDGAVNQVGEECDGDATTCPGLSDVCLTNCTCAPAQRRCGDGTVEPTFGEECEVDGDCGAGEACTSSCTCMDSQCPDTLVWTRFADEGVMSTATDHDSGWTGVAHNNVEPDEGRLIFRLGDVSGAGPAACGTATVVGVDPASRLCRCRDDNRQLCDEPGGPDIDDCGGGDCVCYLENPNPSVSGNVPTCSLTQIVGAVTGTWDTDAGAGDISFDVEQTTSLSALLLTPCATCDGDVTINDGVRDGTCGGGANDGQSCDAQSNDGTFPAPGGGSYSLDCFPGGPIVVSGLFTPLSFTTGARNLDVAVPCGIGGADLCHCGRCDADEGIPCRANADCVSVGGACGPVSVTSPQPNDCNDGTCTDIGDGQGECLADPETYCDGLLRISGRGLIGCNTNADCEAGALGIDAGDCLHVENKSCFPNSVSVSGTPDPTSPIVVSAECIAPSANNPAANVVAGYPGPGFRKMDVGAELRCAGDPGSTYPGCP